ncbi:MAG: extracellular solute-binding protein [Anaerolineae bacterium]|nr:extracellular solute-binding protein [Anaerolineae bacterium]
MNRRLRYIYTILLLGLLVFSFSVQAQGDGDIATPAGEFPIVTEPTVLKILLSSGDAHVADFNNNNYTQWLEEKTGVDLQIEVVIGADAQTKLNLALASGDLPDILLGFPVTASLLSQQGAEGTFLPLNDLMEKYGYETKRVFEVERPQLLPLNTSPDGNIYGLPEINECFHCFLSQKLWVYKPWLDKLGIAMPTTTDEFEAMLMAFKDQDPNGNGIADEVPFSGSVDGQGGWHNSVDQNLMNAFVFYDRIQHDRLLLINDKIEAAYAQPGYREGLRYLHRLYTEGLIDPNGLIQDNAALLQLGSQMDPHLLGSASGGWMGTYTIAQTVAQGGEMDNWIAIPPLKGPEGVQTAAYAPWGFSVGRCVITNKSAHPDVAFRLCDLMYSNEATMRNVFGVEDLDWVKPPEGELGIDGSQAAYRTLGNWDADITTTHWRQVGMTYRTSEFRLTQSAVDQFVEVPLYIASNDMLPYAPPIEDLIPPLTFGDNESRELTEVQLSVKTYVDEMLTRFITGDSDIETEWDSYLTTLDSQGLPRLLEIYQAAYDTQKAVS